MSTQDKAVLSWSSGKDCCHTLHVCRKNGIADIQALLTTVNTTFDRVAMHGTRRELLRRQAKAVGLPLIEIELPWPCSNDDYERIMGKAVQDLREQGFTQMVFGDLFLEDIRAYREKNLEGTGLTPIFPLFSDAKGHTEQLAQDMIASGLEARIVTCDPKRLDPAFAGRKFDQSLLDDLPEGIDPCGENGEFHTAVVNSPEFSTPITYQMGEHVLRDGFAYADVIPT